MSIEIREYFFEWGHRNAWSGAQAGSKPTRSEMPFRCCCITSLGEGNSDVKPAMLLATNHVGLSSF